MTTQEEQEEKGIMDLASSIASHEIIMQMSVRFLEQKEERRELLAGINQILAGRGLKSLDFFGNCDQGEIEILEIVKIDKNPDLRGYCLVTFKCLVRDRKTGLVKEIRFSKKFSYNSDKHCGVIIVAITEDGRLIMPISYRLCYGWRSECPRGFPKGHGPLEDARIELASETGYIAEEMEILQTVDEDTGTSAMSPTIVLATGCQKKVGTTQCHDTEVICPTQETLIPIEEIDEAIKRGKIRDELSLAAIIVARAHGYL